MDYIEFSAKIKEKYPEYKDVDDLTLAQKIVEKYPEYKEKVTFEEVKKEPIKKGIDLTPSGITNFIGSNIGSGLAAPIVAMRDNIPVNEAFEQIKDKGEDFRKKDKFAGIQDFLTDIAGYSTLPVLRGGGVANFLGNAAIQGGIPGIMEALKRGENVASGAGAGTGIAAALQTIPFIGNIASKAVKKGFELTGRVGQIKPETLQQVIKPESTALEMTSDDASNALLDITKQIRNNFDLLRKSRGEDVNKAVMDLGNKTKRFNIKDLLNDVKSTFDQYQTDLINPARELAGGLENNLTELVSKGTENPAKFYEYIPENTSPYFSKEKENEAFKILSAATGKPINWLKSQLKAGTTEHGVGKRKEFIANLIPKTEDKLANLGNEYFQGMKYYSPNDLDDITAGAELASRAFDDIVNNRFNVYEDDILSRALNNADNEYKQLVSKIAQNPRNENLYNTAFQELQTIVKDLPEGAQNEYFNKLASALDDIYSKANTVSPLSLQGIKETIGKGYAKWGDETAKGYAEPIAEQIYGKFSDRLSDLSPQIKAANKAFSDLMAFKKNDTVAEILKGDLLNGDKLGRAPSALKSYKSSINKGSGQENLKNLENLLTKETGQQPFLNKIDDINAAMDLLKTENTGLGGAASLAKAVLTRPVLNVVRGANRMELPQKIQGINEMLKPIGKLMPYLGAKGAANLLQGGVEYNDYR